ncbi:uncharacterized protein BHQ10_010374 [Talaromyces amestolkiae]|uniref:Major facilitator superfamily (MFS) profile domain-containing protein n=1 Tax=Talaromyces amestolkiae TaxID=1196081 RepID=A0A364LEZ2_TALAM|nr:uncharacterized protein BHQ10_010374 [Talaromyces amestolkiae]RAO74362.1 hypothetical protein BHQ10_010374 [Talaromyces amestolkiae]
MHEETSPLIARQQPETSRWYLPLSIYLLSICNFFLAGSSSSLNIPLTRLIEDNLCRRHDWQGAPIDEGRCKTDDIQSSLAYLNGSLSLVEAMVGLVVAFPFAVLADRTGRRPIILLSTVGSVLSLAWELAVISFQGTMPVQLILAGPIFNVVGGGSTILVANLYSMASDMVAATERASAFFLMAFASLAGASVGPAISSGLMEIFSPWISALVGFFALLIGPIVLVFIPETFHASKQDSSPEPDYAGLEEPQRNTFKSHLLQSLRLLQASLRLLYSPSIILVLATFLTRMPEILATSQFLAQYLSKRFDWPLAKTGYLISIRGIIHMVVLLVVLPLLSKVLLRWQQPPVKDLTLARVSAALAAAGALVMASSKIGLVVLGLVLQSLGSGLSPLCRSLATSFVIPQDTSKLNTLIGIVETLSSLFAGPALAWLFEIGVKREGPLLELPYFGLAGLFLLCLVGLLFVRSRRRKEVGDSRA